MSNTRTSADPEALLAGLDPEQRTVATTLQGPLAVIAGAGTGKTRAITHRIAYGVATGVYNPTSVLAVTFTTRAAGELRGRLQQLGARGVQARTFHSAALRQAQYFWPQAYGGELPQVLDNRMSLVAESASRLRIRVDTPRLRDLVSEIGWAKVSNVTAEDYPRLAAAAGRSIASIDAETVARVFTGYENAKRDRGRIDFEDILLCAAALMSEHEQVADTIRRTYRHLVVDEYQDVSPLQQALLTLWRGDRTELCVVGDPAQTIHSFAGAQAGYLTEFARRHPGATVVKLVRDYRSTPQVVGVANKIMSGVKAGGISAVTLQAQQPPGPEVEFLEAPDEASEAAGIGDWLARQASDGVQWRDMAVLFRINAQSPAIEQALADRHIPYLVRGGERFYERAEVRQALLTLRTEARAMGENEPGTAVEQMKAVLGTLGWSATPPEGAGAVRERWESLAALLTVAEDLATGGAAEGGPEPDLRAVSAELDARAEAQHVPVAQGVTVSTLHSAKGLEWEAVALLGTQEGSLPFVLATRPEQVEEERRLLYVGVTRARRRLRLSWSRTRNGGGNPRKPSRFLDPVLPEGARGAATAPRPARRRGSVLSQHCRSCGSPLGDAAERKLGRHLSCPSTFDEQTMALLKEWRRSQAAEQKVPAFCIFTDATLIALAEARPHNRSGLVKVQGLGPTKADRYGDEVLAILGSESERAGA
ncbi:ATP-dependent DNA helicase UvrD2 [uncultured Friedmanniella sp.]|uniref:ATP-dependent DNA helicase UvrD2 n=1 Tax=uncultured Friedmanniella sp. TaxID=335381 RepID=UPI0035C967FD